MKSRLGILVLSLVLMTALFAGCAKEPTAELDAAKAALEAAKTAEADRYLAADFNAAQDSLNAAVTEIETQKSKFALTRSYDHAKNLIASALAAANAAKDQVAAKKEQVRQEVQTVLTEAQTTLAETKTLLKKAPRGKEGRAALEAIQNDLTTIEQTSLAEVNTLLTSGDFLSAKDKVMAANDKLKSIKDELQQAIEKKAAAMKKR